MRFFFITLGIVLVDQLSKQLVLLYFDLPYWLIDQQIGFVFAMNPGIAFSLPIPGALSLFFSSLVVLTFLWIYEMKSAKNTLSDICFALIVGGGLGNIYDRLFHGAVVDFIKIYSYPTFNVADIAVCIGFLIFILRFDRLRV
jgi:signal peptidase II